MEMDENQTSNKGNNINGKIDSNRTNFGDEEAEDGEIRKKKGNGGGLIGCGSGGGGGAIDFTGGGVGHLCGWPTSRIVRVSRASGGKDRHSKVLTSKGLRDRRVRLSVNTAIQFYDLQDRLGYDQPSKAVDWLLKAASSSISELPPISTPFPGTPKQQQQQQLSDTEKRSSGGGKGDVEMEGRGGEGEPLEGKLSKSAGSSNSETSKGSGGGLSRSESRLKARERARERAAKERESENITFDVIQQQQQKHHRNISSMPQNATFTELLSSGFAGTNTNAVNHHSNTNSPNGSGGGGGGIHESNFFHKPPNNWSATAMDYFGGSGLLVPSTTSRSTNNFCGQIQLGNNSMQQALPTHVSSPFFTVSGDTHQEMHSFSLIPEQYVNNNHHNESYNLNFSISSTSSSGFNRGTLQSNSSTLLPQIQRFSSTDNNGSSPSGFFLGAAPPPHSAVGSHHFQPSAFDAGLQLFYGDGSSHADHKGKGKS